MKQSRPRATPPPASDLAPTSDAPSAPDASELEVRVAPHLFESAADGIAVVDEQGAIVLVNGKLEAMFGYNRQELLTQPVERLIPEPLRHAHVQHRAHYSLAPHARPMGEKLTLFGRHRDGSQFPVEISLSPLELEDRTFVMAIIRDVTVRKQLELALQASVRAAESHQHLLQTVLDQLPSGVFLARGPQARLVLANRAAVALWGERWSPGQPMGAFLAQSGVRFLSPTGQPCQLEQTPTLQALRTSKEVVQAQLRVVRPDGNSIPILITAVPLHASLLSGGPAASTLYAENARGAAPVGPDQMVLVVYQDVTLLEEAERVKDEFVTLAAHELRTPIAIASGYAQMLLRAPDGPPTQVEPSQLDSWQVEALRDIASALARLAALTDDLLDVTKLQGGRLQLSLEPHDLVALVRRVCRRVRATSPHITLRLEAADEPLVAEIDVRRIEQVVHNLLGNAIKYSPGAGEIEVTIRPAPSGEPRFSRPMAEIVVRDHGLGIPADQQAAIFARFVRARNAQEHGIEGTGLGLYLCRELVTIHEGSIWFESTEGEGSTFHVVLPLLQPGAAE
jgi:PAS domain S-box-containing protein